MSQQCRMGEYGVSLVKNGVVLPLAGARLKRVEYSRVLDGVSTAQVDIITAGKGCCGQIGAADHWNTDLIITVTSEATGLDEVVWRGPCQKPVYRRGAVTIPAVDTLGWLQVRIMEQDMSFASEDVVDIFEALASYALRKDPYLIPEFEIVTYKTGVQESREIDADSLRMTWNIVQEMLDTGLDVTTFGSKIIAGVPAFTPIDLKDTDVLGEVEIVKDGGEFANRAVANAARDVTGIWPEGPARGRDGYPLVEALVVDSQLPDQASAVAAARARYNFSHSGIRRVRATGGLVLLPSAKIEVKRLLAGQLFNFAATETCYAARETLRLGKLTVVAEKGVETATIELQPTGGVQGGAILQSSV